MKSIKRVIFVLSLLTMFALNLNLAGNNEGQSVDIDNVSLSVPNAAATYAWKLVFTGYQCEGGGAWYYCKTAGDDCAKRTNSICIN